MEGNRPLAPPPESTPLVFGVLGLVFSIPSQEIGSGKRLQNDLFCVYAKPQLDQSISSARVLREHTSTAWIPPTFTVTSEHIRFYFLVFLFYTF